MKSQNYYIKVKIISANYEKKVKIIRQKSSTNQTSIIRVEKKVNIER